MSPKNLSSLDTLENLSTLKKEEKIVATTQGMKKSWELHGQALQLIPMAYTDAFESSTRGTARYRIMLLSSGQRLPGMGFGWKRVYRFSQRTRPNHVGLLLPDR